MRGLLKTTAEMVLAHGGASHVARTLRRQQALVLSYHNVVPDATGPIGDASLHLGRTAFAAQLDALAMTHEIVPLDALLDDPSPRHQRPRVAITFDDAYQGAITIGISELASRGLPATMFVAPRELGSQAFWWDRIADPAAGEVPAEERRRALEEFSGEGDRIVGGAGVTSPAHALPREALTATEDELHDALCRHPGLSLGSHSWSHPNLTRLEPVRLHDELERPLAWLRERFSAVVPWISYPYGLHSEEVRAAAARAGYRGGVTQSGGWITTDTGDPFAIPRLNVPAGLSLNGFIARVSGIL